MTAKEYLNQARLLLQRIRSLELELEYLNTLAIGCNGPVYGGDIITKTEQKQASFVKYLDRIFEAEAKLHTEIEKLLTLKAEIEAVISKIGDTRLELILRERYINGRNWEDIATTFAYSPVYVYKLHRDALARIQVPQEYSKV